MNRLEETRERIDITVKDHDTTINQSGTVIGMKCVPRRDQEINPGITPKEIVGRIREGEPL